MTLNLLIMHHQTSCQRTSIIKNLECYSMLRYLCIILSWKWAAACSHTQWLLRSGSASGKVNLAKCIVLKCFISIKMQKHFPFFVCNQNALDTTRELVSLILIDQCVLDNLTSQYIDKATLLVIPAPDDRFREQVVLLSSLIWNINNSWDLSND